MDPLRQIMSMAEDARKQVDTLVSQGTSRVKATLPELPFPGGDGNTLGLPEGPEKLLANLPKLPKLAIPGEKATPATEPSKVRRPGTLARPNSYKLRSAVTAQGYRLRR